MSKQFDSLMRALLEVKAHQEDSIDFTAVRAWEQGKRLPDISTRHYLRVIERNPQAVVEALQ